MSDRVVTAHPTTVEQFCGRRGATGSASRSPVLIVFDSLKHLFPSQFVRPPADMSSVSSEDTGALLALGSPKKKGIHGRQQQS